MEKIGFHPKTDVLGSTVMSMSIVKAKSAFRTPATRTAGVSQKKRPCPFAIQAIFTTLLIRRHMLTKSLRPIDAQKSNVAWIRIANILYALKMTSPGILNALQRVNNYYAPHLSLVIPGNKATLLSILRLPQSTDVMGWNACLIHSARTGATK